MNQQLPSYHDVQLSKLIKELRSAVKPLPTAVQALEKVEKRLKYQERVLCAQDAKHVALAEQAIADGSLERASTYAWCIWNEELRLPLFRQIHANQASNDDGQEAAARIAEALELEREVINA